MTSSQLERKEPQLSEVDSSQLNPYASPRTGANSRTANGDLLPHQKAARVIRLLSILGLVAVVGVGVAVLLPASAGDRPLANAMLAVIAVCLGFLAFLFFVANALMRRETWARYVGIAYGLLLLTGFPIGTIAGLYILWQLISGWAEGADEFA
ncbi:MAG: hypothetical protein V4857_16780 [Pseudomonadota bacterium]